MSFTLPLTPTRAGFRIRELETSWPTPTSPRLSSSPRLCLGVPNVGAETQWNGDFTGAPVDSGISALFWIPERPLGTEYVSAWIAPATWNVVAEHRSTGCGSGFTVAVDGKVNIDGTPGWLWHSATKRWSGFDGQLPGRRPGRRRRP